MNGAELQLMQEYRKLELDFENFLMIETNNKISKFVDEKGIETYDTVQKICNEINNILNKITDYNNLECNFDEFIEKTEKFYDDADKIINYFTANELVKEIIDIVTPELNLKMRTMTELQSICNKKGYQKISFNMKFGIEKLRKTLSTVLKELFLGCIRYYKNLIIKEFLKTDSRIKEKYEDCMTYYKTNKKDDMKLQKILDCNQMDSFLNDLGYKPVRQNGSHLIYSDGVNSIPVPQHSSLNKGLAYEIQKQAITTNTI